MRVLKNGAFLSESALIHNKQTINNVSSVNSQANFKDVLNNQISEQKPIQFSKHAMMRLDSRNIQLTSEQMQRIEDGISKARQKGIEDSLIVVDNISLVVNVRNNVVITAMNQGIENVFTNIDGAVIV